MLSKTSEHIFRQIKINIFFLSNKPKLFFFCEKLTNIFQVYGTFFIEKKNVLMFKTFEKPWISFDFLVLLLLLVLFVFRDFKNRLKWTILLKTSIIKMVE